VASQFTGPRPIYQHKLELENGSYSAFQGGNQSNNSTAAQQTRYPQLVSCYASDNPNPPSCPGPRQIIWNAYKALAIANPFNSAPAILLVNESFIQSKVFNKLFGSNQSTYSAQAFRYYLQKGFSPYDGTLSTAPLTVLGVPTSQSNANVKSIFDSSQDAATITGVPVLTTFFNPSNFDTGGSGINLWNMGMVFHEGLHGFTGMSDVQLQNAFGCATVDQFKTHNLTYYLEQFILTPPRTNIDRCQ
jgi:hypothetical protein